MEKRGELSTSQIVMIIILIVSFIVILYFFYRLNLGSTSSSEICHNSVILSSKSAGITGGLQCKTDYVCISGGGKCANMNPTITITVDPTNISQIMNALATQSANCWYTFGEGKLNYGSKGIFGSSGCALCFIVEFDNTILSENYKTTYAQFYEYLNVLDKDNTQTYLHYLYGTYDLNNLLNQYPVLKYNQNNSIISSAQYSISTGYNTGLAWGVFGSNGVMPVSYVTTDQLSSQLKCSNFVTQA